jgi:hypothetical protein
MWKHSGYYLWEPDQLVASNPMLMVVAIAKSVIVTHLVSSPLDSHPHIHGNLLFLSNPRLKFEHKQEQNLSTHIN